MKRRILVFPLMLCILAVSLLKCAPKHAPGRPNIVIIFIDDMGYGDLSCYGNRVVGTPNIDHLAEKGTRFTNFYVNSPICSPSRVALNTGCYPMRYRIHSYLASSEANEQRAMANYLDPKAATLAGVLQGQGYATGHFGKWHMGGGRDLGNVPHPGEYGFDKSLVSFEGIGDRVLFPGDNLSEQSAELGRGKIIWAEKHRSTGIYVDSALAFISRNAGRPFFVQLCPNDVHDPHLPDSAAIAQFVAVTANPWEQRFHAVLSELDRQIGRFVSGLDELGILQNTILILTSDNGPTDWPQYYALESYPAGYSGEMGPPGSTGGFFGRKWSLYEGGIRMPLIVRWDGHVPAGGMDSGTVVAAMDLFPSLLTILGIGQPAGLDGLDLSRALLGEPMDRTEPVMWEYASNPGGSIQPGNRAFSSPNLAIREGDWKLLINADRSDPQLYHLGDDPVEHRNLSEAEPDRVDEMAEKVIAWRRSLPVEVVVNQ